MAMQINEWHVGTRKASWFIKIEKDPERKISWEIHEMIQLFNGGLVTPGT